MKFKWYLQSYCMFTKNLRFYKNLCECTTKCLVKMMQSIYRSRYRIIRLERAVFLGADADCDGHFELALHVKRWVFLCVVGEIGLYFISLKVSIHALLCLFVAFVNIKQFP